MRAAHMALWPDREQACISVQVYRGMYNAYADREVGERATVSRAWNPGISLGLLAVP